MLLDFGLIMKEFNNRYLVFDVFLVIEIVCEEFNIDFYYEDYDYVVCVMQELLDYFRKYLEKR